VGLFDLEFVQFLRCLYFSFITSVRVLLLLFCAEGRGTRALYVLGKLLPNTIQLTFVKFWPLFLQIFSLSLLSFFSSHSHNTYVGMLGSIPWVPG
jgi:hypothetical protein